MACFTQNYYYLLLIPLLTFGIFLEAGIGHRQVYRLASSSFWVPESPKYWVLSSKVFLIELALSPRPSHDVMMEHSIISTGRHLEDYP